MIIRRSDEEISEIRSAGKIVALTLEKLKKYAKAGTTTKELEEIASDEILMHGGQAAFKNYKGYPANICTSLNEVVVHGIPSDRSLKEGDILSIDVGVKVKNFYADAAITIGIGRISDTAKTLMKVTEEALYRGIENARPGKRLSDISASIQTFVESNGFSVVRAFVGHGIGEKIHEEPEIPNFGAPDKGPSLEPGVILAIEPMVNAGTFEVEILEDGWTAVTKDRTLSAHFEHTIAVRENGPEILTAA
ncbi:MAG: type I methionyl aminopeptidase [Omnitrophica bacterium RIFCSPLOWO2_01_FULL_45_24]|nr:MAG: type I methionyl aminopeptidase [Omnitrophica bacterium RIFCSPHIGHO2_02_FULL_46_20]OGW93181.1 MAG: type I methionyl aminopeptidase [Omnitrophica bacterium RIFCSPLOWO2_01_FULL_45_24]